MSINRIESTTYIDTELTVYIIIKDLMKVLTHSQTEDIIFGIVGLWSIIQLSYRI